MTALCGVRSSKNDCLCQPIVNVVSAVLDGDDAAAPAPGDYGNRLAAVAAQRKQKRVKLTVLRFDPLDDIFLAFLCLS